MTENASNTSKDLLNVVPRMKGPDLVINKDIRSLEDLRKDFTKSQNSVLSKVRDFLPKLASANHDLQRKLTTNPEFSADIEELDNEEAPYIEMNIALMEGEFESEDSDPDSSDSEDSVDVNVVCGEVTEHNIKLPTARVTKHADGNLIECINTETGPDLVINKDIRSLEDLRKEFTKSHNSVLSQVRDFLPKLASANDDLQRKLTTNPKFSADIEELDNEEAPYIEMNIALMEGEFESEDSDPDSSDSEDSVEDNVVCGEVTEHNIQLPTARVTKHADGNLIECINTETGEQPTMQDNC